MITRSRLAIALVTACLVLPARVGTAQSAPEKKRPDFRMPVRKYEEVVVSGRKFMVEAELIQAAPRTADRALARLNKNIDLVLAILPEHARPHIAKQNFWLMYGPKVTGGGLDNGLAYFRNDSPKFDATLDERWNSVVVVYHAENYTILDDLWALKSVMHELAHAYQLEQSPEKEPRILAAYENAMADMLYRNVRDEKGQVLEKAYATTNQLEYFAEISCMFFARCNYQPLNRAELSMYDPVGYRMVREVWRIGDEFGEHQERSWQIGKSARPLLATFQSVTKTRATLVDSSGKTKTVSLSALSEIDRDYIQSWQGR